MKKVFFFLVVVFCMFGIYTMEIAPQKASPCFTAYTKILWDLNAYLNRGGFRALLSPQFSLLSVETRAKRTQSLAAAYFSKGAPEYLEKNLDKIPTFWKVAHCIEDTQASNNLILNFWEKLFIPVFRFQSPQVTPRTYSDFMRYKGRVERNVLTGEQRKQTQSFFDAQIHLLSENELALLNTIAWKKESPSTAVLLRLLCNNDRFVNTFLTQDFLKLLRNKDCSRLGVVLSRIEKNKKTTDAFRGAYDTVFVKEKQRLFPGIQKLNGEQFNKLIDSLCPNQYGKFYEELEECK